LGSRKNLAQDVFRLSATLLSYIFVIMPAYQPGNGLSRDAMERLRSRKQVGEGALDLPAPDQSKQWDSLLGAGAQKKPRCGVCTRPLSEHEQKAEQLLCQTCTSKPAGEVSAGKRSQKGSYASGCPTPSTEAASDESDCGADESLREESVVKARPPTCEMIMLESVRKGLEGDWVGYGGGSYWIDCGPQKRWTCSGEGSSQTYPLDFDSGSGVVWWGNDRTHFVDISELCAQPDQINWFLSHDTNRQQSEFVFYRRHEMWPAPQDAHGYECSKANVIWNLDEQLHSSGNPDRASYTKRASQNMTKQRAPTTKDVRCSDTPAAEAIFEIEQQLFAPGSEGFVWVNKWNERFLKRLGTLREFLESRPDKFSVIAGKGKGFRVAAVERAR